MGATFKELTKELTGRARADGPRGILSLRAAGDLSLRELERRRRFLKSLGIDPARALFLNQIHSQQVISADRQSDRFEGIWAGRLPKADGLLTADRTAVLCVTVADCLPVFLHDRCTGAFGLLHSGWKGTGIAAVAVRRMRDEFGTDPGDLEVLLGPCIGPCCYAVPIERYDLFHERFGAASVQSRDGRFFLDLISANTGLLENLGVGRVTAIDECTSCHEELCSYRRDGPEGFAHMLAVYGYF